MRSCGPEQLEDAFEVTRMFESFESGQTASVFCGKSQEATIGLSRPPVVGGSEVHPSQEPSDLERSRRQPGILKKKKK